MNPTRKTQVQALAAVITGAVVAAFAIIAAPPAHAYQYSKLCIVNNTTGSVRAVFFKDRGGSITRSRRDVAQGGQECEKDSRVGAPDVSVSLTASSSSGRQHNLGDYFVNNPAVGWPVIVGRLQSTPRCQWSTYASDCWYARLGERQHRCLQEGGYWLRPSREADAGGAKQFRIQIYDGSGDPSTFGC